MNPQQSGPIIERTQIAFPQSRPTVGIHKLFFQYLLLS